MAADWQPKVTLEALHERAAMLRKIRYFFAERDVLEVETPVLGRAFGTDPSIEPLMTTYTGESVSGDLTLYLQSSPEFAMKRLLVAGSGSIYQICKAFRNGESGHKHKPEFTLLEWYRVSFSLADLMKEMADLMRILLVKQDLAVAYHAYADLFEEYLHLDVFSTELDELKACAINQGIGGAERLELDQDAWLDLLMSHCIEPQLNPSQLCFVTDYPASQAALAKINVNDPRTAERFELYYRGMELANGFHELSDAEEQSERFERENCQRRVNNQQAIPIDAALLSALESGLPDCAGVALGLDRVLMSKLSVPDISQVVLT